MSTKTKTFTDAWGEEITKEQAVKEKCQILYDMYIKPDGKTMIPGGRALIKKIFWGFMLNEKYDCSEALDKECYYLIREERKDTVFKLAERVCYGVDWESKMKKKKEEGKSN